MSRTLLPLLLAFISLLETDSFIPSRFVANGQKWLRYHPRMDQPTSKVDRLKILARKIVDSDDGFDDIEEEEDQDLEDDEDDEDDDDEEYDDDDEDDDEEDMDDAGEDNEEDDIERDSESELSLVGTEGNDKNMKWADYLALRRLTRRRSRRRGDSDDSDDRRDSQPQTTDMQPQKDMYTMWFLAVGDIDPKNPAMIKARREAWLHHVQFVRRAALLGSHSAVKTPRAMVSWEYTRLSDDSMSPVGQVLGIRANSTTDALEFLASEPLQGHGAVIDNAWKLYEMQVLDDDTVTGGANFTADLTDPYIFIGETRPYRTSGGAKIATSAANSVSVGLSHGLSPEDQRAQLKYHMKSSERVHMYGILRDMGAEARSAGVAALTAAAKDENSRMLDDDDSFQFRGDESGIVLVFNAKTHGDAKRYVASDPVVASGKYQRQVLSPANEQDTDGRHHLMATSFAQKTELDMFNCFDPEDLLRIQAPVPADILSRASKVALSDDGDVASTRNVNLRMDVENAAKEEVQEVQEVDAPLLAAYEEDRISVLLSSAKRNAKVLNVLRNSGASYAYRRLSLTEQFLESAARRRRKAAALGLSMPRFSTVEEEVESLQREAQEIVDDFNESVENMQKARIRIAGAAGGDVDDENMDFAIASESSGSGLDPDSGGSGDD